MRHSLALGEKYSKMRHVTGVLEIQNRKKRKMNLKRGIPRNANLCEMSYVAGVMNFIKTLLIRLSEKIL